MILDICDDTNLFNLFYDNMHINILNIFLLILCFILFVCLKKTFLNNKLLNVCAMLYMTFFLIYILAFLSFLIFSYHYNGCDCKYVDKTEIPYNSLSNYDFLPNYNKVIVIGDSRMSFIADKALTYNIPNNFSFIAKGGTMINWFKGDAISKLDEKLSNDNIKYHVVINMGVNDVSTDCDISKRADDYFSYYKKLKLKYPDVEFYLLSVNPVSRDKLDMFISNLTLNNDKIELFNGIIKRHLEKFNLINYCDSYHDVYFMTNDGLHYTHKTSQDILDYIKNKCIKY